MRLEHEFGAVHNRAPRSMLDRAPEATVSGAREIKRAWEISHRRAHSSAPFNRRDVLSAGNRYALRATVLTARMPGGAGRADRDTSGIRFALRKAPRQWQITRHSMQSNFRGISNKTNDRDPHKVTHKFEYVITSSDQEISPISWGGIQGERCR